MAVDEDGLLSQLSNLFARHACSGERKPFVTLTYAQSLDGSIAAAADAALTPSQPLVLSGEASLRLTHRLRAAHDAILVGSGTVQADDPRLNVRLCEGTDPLPIVMDGSLRITPSARLVQQAAAKNRENGGSGVFLVVFTSTTGSRATKLSQCPGVSVEAIPKHDTRAALDIMRSRYGCQSIMVEGGATVISRFLAASDLVDYAILTIAPIFVGGVRSLSQPLASTIPLTDHGSFTLGPDVIVHGQMTRSDPSSSRSRL